MAKDPAMMTTEEKRALAAKVLKGAFPTYTLEDFEVEYLDGVSRIRIGLEWFQIDPSEGDE